MGKRRISQFCILTLHFRFEDKMKLK